MILIFDVNTCFGDFRNSTLFLRRYYSFPSYGSSRLKFSLLLSCSRTNSPRPHLHMVDSFFCLYVQIPTRPTDDCNHQPLRGRRDERQRSQSLSKEQRRLRPWDSDFFVLFAQAAASATLIRMPHCRCTHSGLPGVGFANFMMSCLRLMAGMDFLFIFSTVPITGLGRCLILLGDWSKTPTRYPANLRLATSGRPYYRFAT